MDSSDPGRLALPTYDPLYFLFGSHAYSSAVAQTRPYGLKHGLDADSQCKPHNENTLMSYVGSASLPNHSNPLFILRLPDQVTGWIKSLNPIGMGFEICGQTGKITVLFPDDINTVIHLVRR